MEKKKELKKLFIDNVAKFCDKCGASYDLKDITVLDSTSTAFVIQATCHKCKNMHLATLVRHAGVSTKMHLKLDIHSSEVPEKLVQGPISADEILTFHEKLTPQKKVKAFTNT